jgi:hypothetical protein
VGVNCERAGYLLDIHKDAVKVGILSNPIHGLLAISVRDHFMTV